MRRTKEQLFQHRNGQPSLVSEEDQKALYNAINKESQPAANKESPLLVEKILMGVFAICGYGALLFIDWRIAIAFFCLHFGINLEQKIRRAKKSNYGGYCN